MNRWSDHEKIRWIDDDENMRSTININQPVNEGVSLEMGKEAKINKSNHLIIT